MTSLPIDALLPALCAALASRHEAVLEAPPGAGKTTRVPLAVLEQPWLAGQTIIMLDPRPPPPARARRGGGPGRRGGGAGGGNRRLSHPSGQQGRPAYPYRGRHRRH